MQRVLVTGATGFIGGHLVEALLRQGVEVRCLARPTSNTNRLAELDVTLCAGDVTDPHGLEEAIDGTDVVFHVAGLTTALSKRAMWRVNRDGAATVATACSRQQRPPTMVLVSSVAAAGPADQSTARCETDSAAPVSIYGRSKRAGELAVEQFAGTFPITVVRPGIIFGPRDRLTLPIFKTIATWGIHPLVGLGRTKISLLHVADLIELLLAAAESGERLPAPSNAQPAGTGIYFAADEVAPSYRELGLLIAKAMQRRVIPLPTPPACAWTAAAISQLASQLIRRTTPFNLDKIREATQASWAITPAKATRQLGWLPGAPLEARLRETVDWYLAQKWMKVRRLFPAPNTDQE